MERRILFVDVLLPLHIPGTYTYRVPTVYEDCVVEGQRVVVQFGARRLYSAVVERVHSEMPEHTTKYILSVLDIKPVVSKRQLEFWHWLADYYMCYPGDVMAVALPSAFRLSSESAIVIHPDFGGEYDDISEHEASVLDALARRGKLAVDDISSIVGFQKTMPLLKTMIEKRLILMDEELRQRYVPKQTQWLELSLNYRDEGSLKTLLDQLEKKKQAQKQLMAMMRFLQLSHMGHDAVKKKVLFDDKSLSHSAIESLVRKQVLAVKLREESRLESYETTVDVGSIVLNEEQQAAYDLMATTDKPVTLLHGVTSSGKTEIYIKLIDKTIKQGKQVLLLLPEIALTAQIINRLRMYFGDGVGVYHSRFSTNERAEVWKRTMDGGPQGYNLLVGARSALFLPFVNLGLVIVDEEHDPSYKQNDPAPRYSGRDAALYLARLWNAKTVLGSATPSVETYFNAKSGKYALAEVKHRYGGLQMPEVMCVDMKDAARKHEVKQSMSDFLVKHIKEALDNKEQVILFQNRRGFSLRLECDMCNEVPQCKHCDVSLVYHKATNSLRCHYCGYSIPIPSHCPHCGSTSLKMRGFGTERVEDDLSILFPEARIARMDLDSTSKRNRYMEILSDFEDRKIDILVGTQMITKGLDFDGVSVVGILSADNLLSYPDFRSYERGFQQITQVSGRAGRHGKRGRVIVQTYQPYHQALRDAMENDYESMYKSQITERRVFRYPPYYRLIYIKLRHADQSVLDKAASRYADMLRQCFPGSVVGPEYPNVSRVRNQYIKRIMVRFERGLPLAAQKKKMVELANTVVSDKEFGRLFVAFDVDPQ